jgi:hypothetical protein
VLALIELYSKEILMPNPKMIPDPDDATKMIANPDYDPTKNEDGSVIENPKNDEDDLEKKVAERLKVMKEKQDLLDKRARDAETKVAEFERKEREAVTAKLKEEGKLQEAHDRELADRDAKIADLEAVNTKNSRDAVIRDALGDFEFRSAKAKSNAIRDIVDETVKNAEGEWVSKDGKSVEEFAAAFMENDENSTLYLKPKQSTGAGLDRTKPVIPGTTKKGIFYMSQYEVLKRIREGKPIT